MSLGRAASFTSHGFLMPVSLDQFTQQLVASSLMSAADVEAVLTSVSAEQRAEDGEQLARLLVK